MSRVIRERLGKACEPRKEGDRRGPDESREMLMSRIVSDSLLCLLGPLTVS